MEFLLRDIANNDIYTFLVLSSIAILTSIKLLHQNQFEDFLALINNEKYLILYNKRKNKSGIFNMLFYVFFAINMALFLFLSATKLSLLEDSNNIIIAYFILLTNVYLISKYLIEKLVFETLDLTKIYDSLNFQRSTYIYLSSLIIFTFNLFLLYVSPNVNTLFVHILIGVLISLYLLSHLILIMSNRDLFLKYWFYFILYLCAFEISPVLIGVFLLSK